MKKLLQTFASARYFSVNFIRVAIFIVMAWIGGLLTIRMSIITLSFLITTPEVYVPNLGGDFPTPQHGFPYLSGAGRLVLKDIIMVAGGFIIASDSAKRVLNQD